MDLFSEVRTRVPMGEVAQRYGYVADRTGKMRCPFHQDRHPSLQLYPGGKGWWCYVCNTGGSVIDFTAKLFSLGVKEAALKLNQDFNLGLSQERPGRLEQRYRNHQQLVRRRQEEKEKLLYEENQREFIELSQELFFLPKGGRAGEIMGILDYLNHWFEENPWSW